MKAALLGVSLTLALPLAAQALEDALAADIEALEANLDARIGVLVLDTGSDWQWAHREGERFLMASTFKTLLCGTILNRVDEGLLSLDEAIAIRESDLVPYAPVVEKNVGSALTLAELCLATVDMSDNAAANLLTGRLGGPQEVTDFLRQIGDPDTRLDRLEPEVNVFAPGDPRDTSTPTGMLTSWQALLLGDALSDTSQAQLADWLSRGSVTGQFIRAHAPEDWGIWDKSGGGRDHTRNLIAMVQKPEDAPYLIAIFVSDTPADWDTRNAAVSQIAAAIVKVIAER
ncbi:class A beta-lactamase [Cognatishimia sp. MH4019]|uniref:class A beta-lactamase n=1 Tax=Cognatishimia sp. MH4019 TaxID=2854030 RepID=UPI001CD2146B|nr:class A beta-lactamase [Cognatishimia sp. MH4019]